MTVLVLFGDADVFKIDDRATVTEGDDTVLFFEDRAYGEQEATFSHNGLTVPANALLPVIQHRSSEGKWRSQLDWLRRCFGGEPVNVGRFSHNEALVRDTQVVFVHGGEYVCDFVRRHGSIAVLDLMDELAGWFVLYGATREYESQIQILKKKLKTSVSGEDFDRIFNVDSVEKSKNALREVAAKFC